MKNSMQKPVSLSIKPHMSIEDLKTVIRERLTLDIFITLQNGVLIELFADEHSKSNIADYIDTKLYQTLAKDMDQAVFESYFKRIVSAYKNFIQYLSDPTIIIDYEYLWDFITTPMSDLGGGLFPDGINLIISSES